MARAFTPLEEQQILTYLKSCGRVRDALLLEMGSYLGYRVSELLSLKVKDVVDANGVRHEIIVARQNLKGGRGVHCRAVRSRRVVVPEMVRQSIAAYLGQADLFPGSFLFQSREGGNRPISRYQAHRIITQAAAACGTYDRIATHSMRRSFVRRIFQLSGHDLIRTQRIVGHRSPLTTARYLETDQADLDALVLAQAPVAAPAVVLPYPSTVHSNERLG